MRYLVNPGRPIPPESTAIHKITDEMVADKPTFKELAKIIAKDIEGCDIAGYNSNRFDVPLLMEAPPFAFITATFLLSTFTGMFSTAPKFICCIFCFL